MNTFIRKTFLLVSVVFCTFVYAAEYKPATVPDPKKNGQEFYVANPDSILSDDDVECLNLCARKLEAQTDVELCVVALGSIGEMDCFDFSYELFQRWGIGGEGKNTGVLIVFVLDSHDIRIMTGTGIEGVLTDAKCSEIIRNDMVPAFRSGEYGSGICIGALSIYEICTGGDAPEELLNMKSVTNRGKYADESSEDDEDDGMEGWIIGGMVLFCLYLGIREKIKSRKKCPKCHKRQGFLEKDEVKQKASYTQGGSGIHHYKCKKCGHTWAVPYTVPKYTRPSSSSSSYSGGSSWSSSSSSSSSGGSWGGGSTSGGGAGGKW